MTPRIKQPAQHHRPITWLTRALSIAGAALLVLAFIPSLTHANAGMIYYAQQPWSGQGTEPSALTRAQPDGSGAEDISPPSLKGNGAFLFPSVAPNGASMAFLFAQSKQPLELWISQTDGSEAELISLGFAPRGKVSWSPDGQHFAIARFLEGAGSIYIVSRDGSEATQLQTPQTSALGTVQGAFSPLWSPDGTRIAYILQILRPNGHTAWEVRSHSLISNDDEHLYVSPDWSTDGWDVRDLWEWSPDGQWLLVTTNGTYGDRVRRLATDGSEIIELAGSDEKGQGYFGASFSPDGTQIVYSRYSPARGLTYFLETAASGIGDPVRLTSQTDYGEHWPDWANTNLGGSLTLHGVPGDITVDATSSSGAVVTYAVPTATNENSETFSAACEPPPGSTFPVGTTIVSCTATDPDDPSNSVSASFSVQVRGTTEQLEDLADLVQGVGPGTSLADKIATVQEQLANGNTKDACATLRAFIKQVQHQAGKQIPAVLAKTLIASAQQIQQVIPCAS